MKKINILAAIFLLTGALVSCDSERYSAEEKFAPIQKKLMASVGDLTRLPSREDAVSEPYISGKLAAFQKLEKRGNYGADKNFFMQISHFRALEDVYAAAPEEVGTVALFECWTEKKGVYTTNDGKEFPAETEDCDLTMIDRKKDAVVYKRRFEKTPSEERRAYGNTMIRQSAQEDILQFLKGVPRK